MSEIKAETGTSGHKDIDVEPQPGPREEMTEEAQVKAISAMLDCAVSAMARGKQFVDEERFHKCVEELDTLSEANAWETIDVLPGNEAYHSVRMWGPLRILGRIERTRDPRPVDSALVDHVYSARSLTLRADDGAKFETFVIPVESFVEEYDPGQLASRQSTVVFCGAMVPVGSPTGDRFQFYLYSIKLRPTPIELSPMKIVGTSDHPSELVRGHTGFNNIIRYLKGKIVKRFGILGLDEATDLDKALEFVVLQAFSYGKSAYSQRLHGLIIGPASTGKSFVTKGARMLTARSEEVSSVGAKITAAGLIGEVRRQSGRSFPVNGILTRNSGGVVCIQEFHQIRNGSRTQVCSIFSQLMEDGEVTDSTSSGVTMEAETALLLDMNKYSHIDTDGTYTPFTDINIPINVLTRFDFIQEIERDVARQEAVSRKIISNPMGAASGQATEAESREIRQLITWMKEKYGATEPRSTEVNDHVVARAEELLGKFRSRVKQEHLWEDFQTRLARSIDKLLRAIACANASKEIRMEFIDYAFSFIEPKLEFLCSIGETQISSGLSQSAVQAREALVATILRGNTLSVKEIVAELQRLRPTEEVSEKTVQRDLQKIGATFVTKEKKWTLQ